MYNFQNATLVGANDKKKIYIEYGEYLKVLNYAKSSGTDGARGIFLGKVIDNAIIITKTLEAIYPSGDGVEGPSFSAEAWNRIELQKHDYPQYVTVGSYSTHVGVTPTELDKIYQNGFFSGEDMVLFVFDPQNNTEKFYCSTNLTPINGYYLYDLTGKHIDLTLKSKVMRSVSDEVALRNEIFAKWNKKLNRQQAVIGTLVALFILSFGYLYAQQVELDMRYTQDKVVSALPTITPQSRRIFDGYPSPTQSPERPNWIP